MESPAMLRDVILGFVWAGLAFACFALVTSLSPLEGGFAGEAHDVLLVLGSGIGGARVPACLHGGS
jgi:hypothetical protein